MAPTLPKEVVSSIECAIECAFKANRKPDRSSIAAIFNTSYVSVNNIEKRVEQRLTTGTNPQKPTGRPTLVTAEIAQSVRELLERRPGLDQYTISDYVREEFGVRMNQCTVSRMLKAHNIPHKRTNKLHRKTRILPSAVWDAEVAERGAPKEVYQQSSSYLSPYTTTTTSSNNTTYAGPYS
jgi:transposase